MTHYIVQIIIFQLVFLVVYDLFLKKETFFNWNRFYLLVTPVLSVLLPFFKIDSISNMIPQVYLTELPAITIGNSVLEDSIVINNVFQTSNIVWQLWMIGVVLSLLYFSFKYFQIIGIKNKGVKKVIDGISVILIKDSTTAFSFLNTVFLGEELSENQKSTILLHEKTHVDQNHSLDLMVFEILKILFWFNPLVYVFQKRMELLQEYIADATVSNQKNKKEYYQNLLSQVFETQNVSFINTFFNHSLIKNRIIMLQKSKSKKISKAKYLILIPMIFGMLIYSSCAQESELKSNDTEAISKENSEKNKDAVPFAIIDKVPTYPGCTGDNEALKECMVKKIWTLVGEEFNTKVGKDEKMSGKQRIIVKFKIDNFGDITDIKAKSEYPELEKEAKRVVSLIPQMIPGEQDGKAVAVLYTLPIIFEMK